MPDYHTNGQRRTATQARHSKEDALDDREFQLLLEGAQRMDDYYGIQGRFVVLVCGRLGLRRGELAHMTEDWVDWRRNMVVIPRSEPCRKGRDGGVCGDCRQLAEQMVAHNDDLEIAEAIAKFWQPKTAAAAREIPFDFSPRTELVLERYFDRFDRWEWSAQAVNRRLTKAAELAEEIEADAIYPHALRATAASFHAARGLRVLPLQAMFGWAKASTAQHYVKRSGENTARALTRVHSR